MKSLLAAVDHDFDTGLGFVTLTGHMDVADAPRVRSAMLKCVAEHPLAIVADLDRLIIGDPLSLTIFRSLRKMLDDQHTGIVFYAGPLSPSRPEIQRQLARHVSVFDDRNRAVEAAKATAGGHWVHTHLSPETTSPAVARALVEHACRLWGLDNQLGEAQVIVSELVSNAVVHACTDLDVTVVLRDPYLILQVRDHSTRLPVTDGKAVASDQGGGRGLRMVESLSARWGVTASARGKAVWSSIRVRPVSSPPSA